MRLTPGSERDSMWSMPLPSVKKRSKRPVMSVSICSGGMPEKNVATTTTGMLIDRKQIHRHPHQAGDADHRGHQAGHDDEVGKADRESGHSGGVYSGSGF